MRHYVILTVVMFPVSWRLTHTITAAAIAKLLGRMSAPFGSRPAIWDEIFRMKCSAGSTLPCRVVDFARQRLSAIRRPTRHGLGVKQTPHLKRAAAA